MADWIAFEERELVDDTEGLPPLAEGSRWRKGRVTEGTLYFPEFWIEDDEFCCDDYGKLPCVSTARHLLAHHDRAKGCYLPDLLRALAAELEEMADRHDKAPTDFGEGLSTAHRADVHRLLAILDELHEKGIC